MSLTHGRYPITITLNGIDYTVRAGRSDMKNRGDVDPPHIPDGHTIRIRRGLPTLAEEVEVFVHEALHAMSWQSDEEWVTMAGRAIADGLQRAGLLRNTIPMKGGRNETR